MKEIKTAEELEVNRYYHCFDRRFGHHEIHQVVVRSETKCMGVNRIWASNDNPQAFERWLIMGPGEVPQLSTLYLCPKHHGTGFPSDCHVCQKRDAMKQELESA